MEGPTPVSSLLHSATMVTAGIYLIMRTHHIFLLTPEVMTVVAIFGILTAFFSSLMGVSQYDIKRIIAYSTASQLGFLTFLCGMGFFSLCLFHLVNHAFFKCMLFLGSGVVIHALGDQQDIRRMGGLAKFLPFSYIIMQVGSLSLIGFPFLSGFYSKDLIFEALWAKHTPLAWGIFVLASIAAFFTAFYSTRLIILTFYGTPRYDRKQLSSLREDNIFCTIPLVILAVLSIISGFYGQELFKPGSPFLRGFTDSSAVLDIHFVPTMVKLFPTFLALAGVLLCTLLFAYPRYLYTLKLRLYNIYVMQNKRFFYDALYNALATRVLHFSFNFSYVSMDRGLLEVLGPTGLYRASHRLARVLSRLHSGYIFHYAIMFWLTLISVATVFLISRVPIFYIYAFLGGTILLAIVYGIARAATHRDDTP